MQAPAAQNQQQSSKIEETKDTEQKVVKVLHLKAEKKKKSVGWGPETLNNEDLATKSSKSLAFFDSY